MKPEIYLCFIFMLAITKMGSLLLLLMRTDLSVIEADLDHYKSRS